MDQLKNSPQEARLHFLDYWRIIRIRKTVILAVFLLVVITATVVTLMYPESSAAKASIQVEQERPDINVNGVQGNINGDYNAYFLLTEFETIQSQPVLSRVSEKLDLKNVWGKKYNNGQPMTESDVEQMIKGRLDLQNVRKTKFITIKAYSDSAEEAAKLANQVAESYRDYRSEEYNELKHGGINSLQAQLQEQDQMITTLQSNVDYLRTSLNIPAALATASSPSEQKTYDSIKELSTLRGKKEAEYNQQATLLEKLKTMSPTDLRKALPIAYTDTQLNELISEYDLAHPALIKLKIDYTPDHPKYKSAQELVDDLDRKINERVEGILLGLDAKVAYAKSYLDTLNNDFRTAQSNDIQMATTSAPYFAAKELLEQAKLWRQTLSLKTEQERTDVNLPRGRMVTIMDKAIPEFKAVRPNKPLNIALGVVFGLVVGVGLAFFIEYLDTSVKTIDDVERTLGAPVLGVIPQNIGLIMNEGAESPHAEAYRVLRTNILFSRKDDKLNTVVVVSAGAGEGKSTTAFNLATIFAQNGARVLVVDSDLRRPTLHKMLDVSNSFGLTNYLLKQNTLDAVFLLLFVLLLFLLVCGF